MSFSEYEFRCKTNDLNFFGVFCLNFFGVFCLKFVPDKFAKLSCLKLIENNPLGRSTTPLNLHQCFNQLKDQPIPSLRHCIVESLYRSIGKISILMKGEGQ